MNPEMKQMVNKVSLSISRFKGKVSDMSEIKAEPSSAPPMPGRLTPPLVPTGTRRNVVINLGLPSACPISVENVSAQAVATEPENPIKKRALHDRAKEIANINGDSPLPSTLFMSRIPLFDSATPSAAFFSYLYLVTRFPNRKKASSTSNPQ